MDQSRRPQVETPRAVFELQHPEGALVGVGSGSCPPDHRPGRAAEVRAATLHLSLPADQQRCSHVLFACRYPREPLAQWAEHQPHLLLLPDPPRHVDIFALCLCLLHGRLQLHLLRPRLETRCREFPLWRHRDALHRLHFAQFQDCAWSLVLLFAPHCLHLRHQLVARQECLWPSQPHPGVHGGSACRRHHHPQAQSSEGVEEAAGGGRAKVQPALGQGVLRRGQHGGHQAP
mmetsp:Transcript_20403/g.47122  ORF Transcript_20403/g.47122 Transcript_20403/m.47122 type:complete len:232 (+) Transcript_20403:1282-1977(+)